MQSRLGSLMEALINIALGFSIALISQMVIFPRYGIHITLLDNIEITGWFTLVSLVRSYFIRRWFNLILKHRVKPTQPNIGQINGSSHPQGSRI